MKHQNFFSLDPKRIWGFLAYFAERLSKRGEEATSAPRTHAQRQPRTAEPDGFRQHTKFFSYENNYQKSNVSLWVHRHVHANNDLPNFLRRKPQRFHRCTEKMPTSQKNKRMPIYQNRNYLPPYYNDDNRMKPKGAEMPTIINPYYKYNNK